MSQSATRLERLTDLVEIKHGFAFSSEYFGTEGDYILLTPGNFFEAGGFRDLGSAQKRFAGPTPSAFILQKGDVLIAMTEQSPGLLGSTIKVPQSGIYLHNQRLGLLSVKRPDRVSLNYLYHAFNAPHIRKEISAAAAGTKVKHTSPTKLSAVELFIPSLEEQDRTANLLDEWDTAIRKTEQLIAVKERHFAATSHLLLTARKRMNGFAGRRELRRADEIFENTSRKGHLNEPLLSVTQERGVIPRDMLEGRVTMPSGETGAFKLVEPGNFVISLRSFQGGLEHSNYRGLVSPAYTVLRDVVEIDNRFFRHYFKSADFIKRLSVAVIGIRDGKQISFQDFCSIKLPFPPVNEQKAIAAFLDEAEGEISLLRKYTDALKTQKRGLMRKLLTGQWRPPLSQHTTKETVEC